MKTGRRRLQTIPPARPKRLRIIMIMRTVYNILKSKRKIHIGKVPGPNSCMRILRRVLYARCLRKIRQRSAARFGETGFRHDDLTNRTAPQSAAAAVGPFGDIRKKNSDLPFSRAHTVAGCRHSL